MVEEVQNTLKCLKKHGAMNTFRLARELGTERHEIFNTIKELEEKGLIEFRHGIAKFINSVPKIRAKHKTERKIGLSSAEKLKAQAEQIERLEERIRTLQQKVNAVPKVITKTVVKRVIKRVPVKVNEFKRFRLSGFNLDFIKKNLIKNIQQLNVPNIFRHAQK